MPFLTQQGRKGHHLKGTKQTKQMHNEKYWKQQGNSLEELNPFQLKCKLKYKNKEINKVSK